MGGERDNRQANKYSDQKQIISMRLSAVEARNPGDTTESLESLEGSENASFRSRCLSGDRQKSGGEYSKQREELKYSPEVDTIPCPPSLHSRMEADVEEEWGELRSERQAGALFL